MRRTGAFLSCLLIAACAPSTPPSAAPHTGPVSVTAVAGTDRLRLVIRATSEPLLVVHCNGQPTWTFERVDGGVPRTSNTAADACHQELRLLPRRALDVELLPRAERGALPAGRYRVVVNGVCVAAPPPHEGCRPDAPPIAPSNAFDLPPIP